MRADQSKCYAYNWIPRSFDRHTWKIERLNRVQTEGQYTKSNKTAPLLLKWPPEDPSSARLTSAAMAIAKPTATNRKMVANSERRRSRRVRRCHHEAFLHRHDNTHYPLCTREPNFFKPTSYRTVTVNRKTSYHWKSERQFDVFSPFNSSERHYWRSRSISPRKRQCYSVNDAHFFPVRGNAIQWAALTLTFPS